MYWKQNDYLREENKRLRAEVERLSIDAVTGIAGRGVFDRAMVTGYARAKRSSHPMGILMIDIDHFKHVNDVFGHQAGDRVLRDMAVALGYHIRGTDVLARYGGEEFAVVVDDANPVGLAILAENMRRKVEAMNRLSYPMVSVSIGWAIEEASDGEAASILKRADAAMYVAKANGRNRVERG